MKTFQHVLANSLLAIVTTNFTWFALTYWSYLETESVLATSLIGGLFAGLTALSGLWFGSIVDHHRKKYAMLLSGCGTLAGFVAGLGIYLVAPAGAFQSIGDPWLWALIVVLIAGAIMGNIRAIALSTLVTILVPEDRRDRANGMVGTVMGVSFAITSVASGLALGFGDMGIVLGIAICCLLIAILHLILIPIPEVLPQHADESGQKKKLDLAGTIAAVRSVPGLFGLIFFTTFNNFLGGVYMALMDPYGLSLVSVQVWGVLWGFLSIGFIAGGWWIAHRGLGADPLRNLFRINIALWLAAIAMAAQPWIALLAACMFIWICLVPFVEATEQTVIQKVVPLDRQGRVFGFAQSIEQAASPVTAFLIGPIAQFVFIPFMTTGAGVQLIGDWFGIGAGRGIGLVFIAAGCIGLAMTLIAMRSRPYRLLREHLQRA